MAGSLTAIAVCLLVVVPVSVFLATTAIFTEANCSGSDFAGECDTASANGFLYAGCALLLGVTILVPLTIWATSRRTDSSVDEAPTSRLRSP